MKGKDKNKKPGFPDFLRYRQNNLTGNEKNSFERDLQRDPFAAEAEEGFSTVDQSVLKKDMEELGSRLSSRTGKEKKYVWYRIAASVAVLMVITTIFFLVQKNKPEEMTAAGEKKDVVFDIQQPEAVKDNVPLQVIAQHQDLPTGKASTAKTEQGNLAAGEGKMRVKEIIITDSTEVKAYEMISEAAERKKAEAIPGDAKMAVSDRSIIPESEMRRIRGRVTSSEDNLPIPGVTIAVRGTTVGTTTDTNGNFTLSMPEKKKSELIASFIGMKSKEFSTSEDSVVRITMDPDLTALDEVIVVGYGVKKVEEDVSYIAASPVPGRTAFNRYIEENIIRPVPGTQREVVVLSFTVTLNGDLTDIKVLRSPDKLFSDEAIRLVKNGPRWKPGVENGVNIEDEVRVRIVFK
jgi:TonB family protein